MLFEHKKLADHIGLFPVVMITPYDINLILDGSEISWQIFVFVLIVSSISQLGDIVISYFKRLSNIKDTGKIIPGHGGLLDRIDGMIFAFPISYLVLSFNILQIY